MMRSEKRSVIYEDNDKFFARFFLKFFIARLIFKKWLNRVKLQVVRRARNVKRFGCVTRIRRRRKLA